MKSHINTILENREFFYRLFGQDPVVTDSKRRMLRKLNALFKKRFIRLVNPENLLLL